MAKRRNAKAPPVARFPSFRPQKVDTIRLLRAYADVHDVKLRESIVQLVETAAETVWGYKPPRPRRR